MTKDADNLATLQDLQRQLAELVRAEKAKRAKTLRRRGKQIAYSHDLATLPGPAPTPEDIARAKRLMRKVSSKPAPHCRTCKCHGR